MFTNEEIKMLQKGLDALLAQGMQNAVMSIIMTTMLTNNKEERDRIIDEEMNKAKKEKEELEDRIIVLKAKLIGLKDKDMVETFISDTLK